MPCKYCSYIVTRKGSPKEHQMSVYEGVKYLFKHCSYEAFIIGHLKEHQKQVHEEVQFPLTNCKFEATANKIPSKTPEGSSPVQTLQL